MADTPPTEPAATPSRESGTVNWFDANKKIGVINRADGTTIFMPDFGLTPGQPDLGSGQPVEFVVKTNAKGPYAAEVIATGEVPISSHNLALQIASALGETAPSAIAQLRRIARHLGAQATRSYVAEAKRIEDAGGMMLPDGSRRRTLGGVFFVLVRNSLTPEEQERIFPPLPSWKEKRARSKKPRQEVAPPPPPPPPPLTWDDRLAFVEGLSAQCGKVSNVKVTLIGRPVAIEERPQVTLLTLAHSGPLPAFPKGVPVPDPVPTTTYSVYIGKKQWKGVAEALQNPEDTLIIEGTQVLDAATGTIAVFAMKTTTKLLQQASRQPKPAEGSEG